MAYVVRRVLANEYPKYRKHLKSLDPESRHLRFGYTVRDEAIDSLCDEIDKHQDQHVLFCVENSKLDFIAIGHIALVPEMELAFSVLKKYQGRGLGQKLMRRCIQWCRTKNILNGCMVCLSHNTRIKHMCIKNGIHVQTDHGEALGTISLDKAGVDTFFDEASDMNSAVVNYMLRRVKLPWTITKEIYGSVNRLNSKQ
jgi:GNAT superfamily N-acetyltransferase